MVKIIRGKNSNTIIVAYGPGEKKVNWKPKFKVFTPKRRSQSTNNPAHKTATTKKEKLIIGGEGKFVMYSRPSCFTGTLDGDYSEPVRKRGNYQVEGDGFVMHGRRRVQKTNTVKRKQVRKVSKKH